MKTPILTLFKGLAEVLSLRRLGGVMRRGAVHTPLSFRPSRCECSACSSARAALSTRRAAPLERLGGEKHLAASRCEETVLTPFDSDRDRGAVLSDGVQGACRVCAALHARRCSTARSALGAVRRRRTAFTVLRCEETPFTLSAMNRARSADS